MQQVTADLYEPITAPNDLLPGPLGFPACIPGSRGDACVALTVNYVITSEAILLICIGLLRLWLVPRPVWAMTNNNDP